MKKYINHILFSLILSILACSNLMSEDSSPIAPTKSGAFKDFYFGIGLAGTNFIEDTPSWIPMQFTTKLDDYRIGGSFDGIESGLHLSVVTNLDDDSDWMLPLTFEYNWLSASEEIFIGKQIGKFKHTIDVQKIGTGIQWNFYTFQFDDVSAYMGAEFKAVFINNQNVVSQLLTKHEDGTVEITNGPYPHEKPNAVRFGSEFKLGFRGELDAGFYINTFLGMELLNTLGKDNERKELFTPYKNVETEEQYVGQWHFVLMIEYKL